MVCLAEYYKNMYVYLYVWIYLYTAQKFRSVTSRAFVRVFEKCFPALRYTAASRCDIDPIFAKVLLNRDSGYASRPQPTIFFFFFSWSSLASPLVASDICGKSGDTPIGLGREGWQVAQKDRSFIGVAEKVYYERRYIHEPQRICADAPRDKTRLALDVEIA